MFACSPGISFCRLSVVVVLRYNRQSETGGVPGMGGGVIGGNNMAGRGGPFWGPLGAPYPRGGPPQGGPSQSGQAGGPPHGGQVGWGPQGGAGQGAAGLGNIYMHPCPLVSLGLANPVGTGGGHNQMSAPSVPSPFGIGGRWSPQTTPRGAPPNPRSRWGPPMAPRPLANNIQGLLANSSQGSLANSSQGSLVKQQPGFAGQQQSGFIGQQQPGFREFLSPIGNGSTAN